MVEPLRFCSFRRLISCVKETERSQSRPVHIDIHRLFVVSQYRLDKCIVGRRIVREPTLYHLLKHDPDFLVCQLQVIFQFSTTIQCSFLHPQVTTGQKQAPDSIGIAVQLTEYNLFVNPCMEGFALQQVFHHRLYLRFSFPDQLSHKAVGTGIRPIGCKTSLIQIMNDRPRIINVRRFPKSKAVIPGPDFLFFRKPEFIHSSKHFFFRESKYFFVLTGSRSNYLQIIQIGKD